MEVNLADNVKPHSSSRLNTTNLGGGNMMMRGVKEEIVHKKEENKKCTTTKNIISESSIGDNDDSGLLLAASLPKAEVKLKKLDESKLLMDNNENSLSVDTLIEILSSSNETKLPIIDNVKSELINIDNDKNVPPISNPSTLNSPSSSSSTSSLSKSGFNSPSASETSNNFPSHVPSPRTNASALQKKIPSPPHSNGGKPRMIADMNKKMKQIAKRQPKPVYQSQISDNSVGIKLCIKKSINTFKAMPSPNSNNSNNKSSRKRSRKSNKSSTSKGQESDSDDPYVKRRKKPSNDNNSNSTKTSFEEPIEQSMWGKALPAEVLVEVS